MSNQPSGPETNESDPDKSGIADAWKLFEDQWDQEVLPDWTEITEESLEPSETASSKGRD